MSEIFELSRRFGFESAHYLPHAPHGHKCRRMHGHSFEAKMTVRGAALEDRGWVIDFDELAKLIEPIRGAIDHRVLNEVPGLENPTSEMIAKWIWSRIEPSLPSGISLVAVEVSETCNSAARFAGARLKPR
jgi:6-pyruvoyltetrahydropterin/6-carboxytetrahydropterin synthase